MIKIVDMQGGFGNQLFQYAFIYDLMKKGNNVFVFIGKGYNTKNNEDAYTEKREIIIRSNDFRISRLNKFLYYLLEIFKKIPILNKSYYEIVFEKEYNPDKKYKFITSLNGFWQDLTLVDNVIYDIRKVFYEKKILSNEEKKRTLVQVRRGDFKSVNNDLKITFYKEALLKINKNISKVDFDVVTDDVEWVKSNELFSKAKNIYPPTDNRESVLELFTKMLTYQNYIVGNSTFTLWAAIIAADVNSKVIIDKKFGEKIKTNESKNFLNWISI